MLCRICKTDKPQESFAKRNKGSISGYQSRCKDCHSIYMREVWYPKNKEKQKAASKEWKKTNQVRVISTGLNISVTEAEKFIKKGKVACGICGTSELLRYDHCHTTKTARGILCNSCNVMLGLLGDSLEEIDRNYHAIRMYLTTDNFQGIGLEV